MRAVYARCLTIVGGAVVLFLSRPRRSIRTLSDRFIDTLGFLAGTLTTLSFVPQVAKAWRTRSTGDLSLTMLVAFTSGVLLWLIYGMVLGSLPVILANAVTLGLSGVLLALKLLRARRQ